MLVLFSEENIANIVSFLNLVSVHFKTFFTIRDSVGTGFTMLHFFTTWNYRRVTYVLNRCNQQSCLCCCGWQQLVYLPRHSPCNSSVLRQSKEERGSKKRRVESSAGSLYDTLSSSAPAAIISGSGSSSYLIPLSIEVEDEMESGPDNLEAGPSDQQQHDSPSGMEVSETGPSNGQYRDSQQQQYSAGQQGVAAQHHHRRRLFCSSGSPTGG